MKLLPQNPMVEAWRLNPGDRTTLLVLTDWLEEQGNPDAVTLRKLVLLWESGLFLPSPPEKKGLAEAFESVPAEWCGLTAAGIAVRCSLWLGDEFKEVMGDLVSDLTEVPEEDLWWGKGNEGTTPSPASGFSGLVARVAPQPRGSLGKRASQAGRSVAKAIGLVASAEEKYRDIRHRDDLRSLWAASAVSYACCAASRVAKMRIWRGEPVSGQFRGASHPQDLLQSAAFEVIKSRAYAKYAAHCPVKHGYGPKIGFAYSNVAQRERRWQLAWLASVAHVAKFPAGRIFGLLTRDEHQWIMRVAEE